MKGKIIILCAIVALIGITVAEAGTPPVMMRDSKKAEAAWAYADSTMKGMTDEEMLAQLVMPMIWPKEDAKSLSSWDKIIDNGFGGVLWQKGTPSVQLQLTNRMRSRAKVPMLVAMDGEWGLSMRLSGTISWPRNMVLGATNDLLTIFEYGRTTAKEARRMGIHVNFAPVADVNNNPSNPVIGTRSFGSNPTRVANQVIAYAQGLESLGVLSVAKHFPGHGDTNVDSHRAVPTIKHNRTRLDSVELFPFQQYINNGLGGMMTGHLSVPALDSSGRVASTSHSITTKLLQEEMGFEGLIFTDGLAMQGAIDATNGKSLAEEVFNAGNDIFLAPTDPNRFLADLKNALKNGKIGRSEVVRRCRKVLAWKYLLGAHDRRPIPTVHLSEDLNDSKSLELLNTIYEQSVTLLKNNGNTLPFSNRGKMALLRFGDSQTSSLLSELQSKHDVKPYALNTNAGERSSTYKSLRSADHIVIAVTSEKARPDAELIQLARDKEVTLLFMTSAYTVLHFKEVIALAKAVAIGYDNKEGAQRAMGKALNGAIPFKGTLPVELPPIYKVGAAIATEQALITFAKPEEVGLNSIVLSGIDKIVEEGLSKGAYPGCQVLVAKDGKVVYSKAFGHKDAKKREPNSTATLYDMASITKAAVTTPLIMMAEEEGLLKTSDKIGDHLDYLKGSDKEEVRISDLLHHVAGLPAVINFYLFLIDQESYTSPLITYSPKAGFPIQIARKSWARRGWRFLPSLVQNTSSEQFPVRMAKGLFLNTSVKGMMREEIRNAELRRGGYRYSDIDFLLLQDILEAEYQKSLDQIFDEKIARPLGVQRLTFNPLERFTTSDIAEGQRDNFLRGQTLRGDVDDEAAAMLGGVSGNAGLFGNAESLFPVVQMLLDGTYGDKRLMKEVIVEKFTTAKDRVSPYALGFDRHRGPGKIGNVADIAPLSTFGHTGFTGTCFWVDPENEIVYIFLSNRIAPTRWNNKLSQLDIRTRIQETIYKALK